MILLFQDVVIVAAKDHGPSLSLCYVTVENAADILLLKAVARPLCCFAVVAVDAVAVDAVAACSVTAVVTIAAVAAYAAATSRNHIRGTQEP